MLMKQFLQPGGIFIDGGANIGELTLFAAKRVGPAGKVFSFEPVAGIRKKLVHHIDQNKFGAIVSVREQGLSDQVGTHIIYGATSSYNDGSQHNGLGTLFPTGTRGSELGTIELTTIDQTAKDANLTRLDGIKLDIEGAELPALRGATEALQRFKPWLIVEIGQETCHAAGYEPADVLAALPGYNFFRIERHGRLVPIKASGLQDWQNVMCLPNAR